MTQFFGAVLVLGCGLWLGNGRAGVLEERTKALKDLAAGIDLLGRELALRGQPLPELLERMGGRAPGLAGQLFARCGAYLREEDARFSVLWQVEVDRIPHLCREDVEILYPLGEVLGRFSGPEQRQMTGEVCRQLERAAQCAQEDSRRLGRVYRTLGAVLGGFLLILLL